MYIYIYIYLRKRLRISASGPETLKRREPAETAAIFIGRSERLAKMAANSSISEPKLL